MARSDSRNRRIRSRAESTAWDSVAGRGRRRGGAILGHKVSVDQERNEFVPREIVSGGGEISKVQRKPAGDEMRSGGHITVEKQPNWLYQNAAKLQEKAANKRVHRAYSQQSQGTVDSRE